MFYYPKSLFHHTFGLLSVDCFEEGKTNTPNEFAGRHTNLDGFNKMSHSFKLNFTDDEIVSIFFPR